jgi:drug/metabolite transporter (DMT)-like permease
MPTRQGTLVSLLSGLGFMTIVVLLAQPDELLRVSPGGLAIFALVGVLNFPMGRFFNYLSIDHIGVGRSTPILASSPLFALIVAVVFTGERLTLGTAAGTALILGGVYLTLRARLAAMEEDED